MNEEVSSYTKSKIIEQNISNSYEILHQYEFRNADTAENVTKIVS